MGKTQTRTRSRKGRDYLAQSFSVFSARTLTLLEAGLAGMSRTSPGLKGFGTFFWAGLAGTFFFSIFTSPGMVIAPGPLLLRLFWISAARASRTAVTSFFDNSVAVGDVGHQFGLGEGFLGGGSSFCHGSFFS